jgi:pimeloyl-ACP methyl ester carboxylesterase
MGRATLIGNSFGTIIASWILRHSPESVHSTVLIDHICLQLARADVAFASIHHKPVSAADFLLEYFVFKELSLGEAASVVICLMLRYTISCGERSDPQEDYIACSMPNVAIYDKLTSLLIAVATLARNFYWFRNILWAEDSPDKKCSVEILSSNDSIVPSASVRNYLVDKGIDHVWLDRLGHAGFLKRPTVVEGIVEQIKMRGQMRSVRKKTD